MRQSMLTVTALAAFGVMVATAQAENQTPSPPTASHSVKKRTVSQTARPSQAVSAAQQRECKSAYVGGPVSEVCNLPWGHMSQQDRDWSPRCARAWRYVCSR
jgi:hypothetical protein